HEEGAHDRQRDRQRDRYLGTDRCFTLEVDDAAQTPNVRLDDVHPDAASTEVIDLVASRQARQKHEGQDVFAGQLSSVLRRQFAEGHGAFDQELGIDAAAVVLDLDDHMVALLVGVERDRARSWLAHRQPPLHRLDAVIDRVAYDVHEWVAQLFDDQFVDLRLTAGHHESNVLADVSTDLANDARQSLEHLRQ